MRYERFLITLVIAVTIVLSQCSWAQSNSVYIDQIGSNNSFTVDQDDAGRHSTAITTGVVGNVDYNTFSILQHGAGNKTAAIEIKSGINNTIEFYQRGTGNHTASIIGFEGSGNDIKVNQNGGGAHNFTLTATGTNNGNSVYALQEGSADKTFSLNMNGTAGASVTVQQTNTSQANSGSMTIQCVTCGSYSYIRN